MFEISTTSESDVSKKSLATEFEIGSHGGCGEGESGGKSKNSVLSSDIGRESCLK